MTAPLMSPVILLGGGDGKRAGGPKGLIQTSEGYWIELQLEKLWRVGIQNVFLVLGNAADDYLKKVPRLQDSRVHVVINPESERGPFSSFVLGAEALLTKNFESAFVLPIDVPVADVATWRALEGSPVTRAQMPEFKNRGGHPVWLRGDFLKYCLSLPLDHVDSRLDVQLHKLNSDEIRRIPVTDPSILLNFNIRENFESPLDILSRDAALLSVVEVGLGSLLHAAHIPLRGHLLSLNEIFFLTRAVNRSQLGCVAAAGLNSPRLAPFYVANVAAVLKSLSPAGKRLGPMLAISMQGALFSLGTLVLGPSWAGCLLGAALSSFWAFVQPLIIFWIFFGPTFLEMIRFFWERIQEQIPVTPESLRIALFVILGAKVLLSQLAVVLAYRLSESQVSKYESRLLRWAGRRTSIHERLRLERRGTGQNLRAAALDLFHPLFLLSLILTGVFLWYTHVESSRVVWLLLRPLALGFVSFWAVRSLNWEWLFLKVEMSPFPIFGRTLRRAIEFLRRR